MSVLVFINALWAYFKSLFVSGEPLQFPLLYVIYTADMRKIPVPHNCFIHTERENATRFTALSMQRKLKTYGASPYFLCFLQVLWNLRDLS